MFQSYRWRIGNIEIGSSFKTQTCSQCSIALAKMTKRRSNVSKMTPLPLIFRKASNNKSTQTTTELSEKATQTNFDVDFEEEKTIVCESSDMESDVSTEGAQSNQPRKNKPFSKKSSQVMYSMTARL